jgi:hypothetical protein
MHGKRGGGGRTNLKRQLTSVGVAEVAVDRAVNEVPEHAGDGERRRLQEH